MLSAFRYEKYEHEPHPDGPSSLNVAKVTWSPVYKYTTVSA